MSTLPAGWCWSPIRDIGEVRLGRQRSPDRATGPHMRPYMRAANVTWAGISTHDVKEMDFSPEEYEVFALAPGDLLVGEASGSKMEVGKSAIWRAEVPGACFQNTLIRVRTNKAILPEFLQKHLSYDALRGALAEVAKGIGIHHLGAAGLAEWRVGVPPLAEQKRIADKLDTLLARVDACRTRLDRVPAILARFRQAVLDAAAGGELTSEWRHAAHLPHAPTTVTLSEIAIEVRNGLSPRPAEAPPGIKILRIGAVRPGALDLEDCRYLVIGHAETDRYRLRKDDLLFTRYNGSLEFVGVCARVREVREDYVYPDKLIRVRVNCGAALPAFVEIAFAAAVVREQVKACVKSSAGQKGISGADLKNISFVLLPLEEQTEIVRRVESLFALADSIEARYQAARAQVERLTPALLAKAFRGELVPQDPNDEPASALLARLRRETFQPSPTRGGSARRAAKRLTAHSSSTAP